MRATPTEKQAGSEVQIEAMAVGAEPDGLHWQDGIYLVPTSDVDGRHRWETIIVLLTQGINSDSEKQILGNRADNSREAVER